MSYSRVCPGAPNLEMLVARSLCRMVGVAAVLACAFVSPTAFAQDAGLDSGLDGGGIDGSAPTPGTVVAVYCADPALECTIAPLAYEKTVQLPIAFDWDTGWIPNGSDLQVRFYVKMPAETTVKLNGFFQTDWPDAMTLSAPPGRNAYLGFDYGLEVGAQAKIDTSILGIPIKWTGNIPFVPQVDFHLQGATLFDPWAFAPDSASASAYTPQVKLFDVNLLGLAGIPSQISKGGVSLNIQGELKATYTTQRIMIDPAGANETPITTEGGTALRAFAGGAYVEYDVWPEGTVHYDGALHLIPSFFVEALGYRLDIPIVDFPITIPIGDQDFTFDPIRVHVPLPDIPPLADDILDFGAVVVGDGKKRTLSLDDIGEATARATGFVDAQYASSFKLLSPTVQIDPGATESFDIRFTPQKTGLFKTTLTLVTNDPDNRFITVTLRGTGVDQAPPDYPVDEAGVVNPPVEAGTDDAAPGVTAAGNQAGCGCRTTSNGPTPAGGSLLALAGVALYATRRRRGTRRTA